MARSPWHRGWGVEQGRITPTLWTTPHGEKVFVLGSEVPGRFAKLESGAFALLEQSGQFNSAKVLHYKYRLRCPAVPEGLRWEFSFEIDGNTVVSRLFDADDEGRVFDVRASWAVIEQDDANSSIGFRLQLQNGAPSTEYEVELPGLFIDDLQIENEVPADLLLHTQMPQPGDTNGERSGACIRFFISDFAYEGSDNPSTVAVYVNGVLVRQGGVGQNGWLTGGAVINTHTLEVTLTPPAPLPSSTLHTVRVVADAANTSYVLDQSYSYTTEDAEAPEIFSVVGREPKFVRVRFDEPVVMTDEENGALALANYSFVGVSLPTAEVTAASIVAITDSEVEIEGDRAFTPGGTYRLTVTGVEDLFGNAIEAPGEEIEFVAFTPPQPAGRDFDLWKKLPDLNRRQDLTGDLRLFISCLQELFDLLLYDIDKWTEILDPDFAPEEFVDAMLADLGNPFPFDLSLTDKRRLLRVLVAIYNQKGTAAGIVNAIRFFVGIEVEVVEWLAEGLSLGESELGIDWELGPSTSRDRYSYEIVAAQILTETQRDQIRQIAEYMHPAHTHLRQIIEPETPEVIDHLELGLSELGGEEWQLH